MTELLFIRHGETDHNKNRLFYGHLDPDINQTGIEQLNKTKLKLQKFKEKIDVVFCSDLKRCRQSLEILEISDKVKKNFTKELREINFGILEGKTYKEIEAENPYYIDQIENNWRYFKVKNGESVFELQNRIVKKIEEIIKNYQDKKILVVVHGGVIQSLISYYLTKNLDFYWNFKVDNGSITKMTVTEDNFVYFNYINR